MLPDDDKKEFDSLDDFMGDRSLLGDGPSGASPETTQGASEARGFVTDQSDDFEAFDKFLAKEKRARFPGVTSAQRKVILAMMMTLTIVGVAVGALLFTQTLTPPSVTPAPPVFSITKNCDPAPPTPSTIVAGTSSFVIWECSATQGAFTTSGAPGSATPTVTTGSPWTTTFIFFKSSGTPPTTACSTASHNKQITSGSSVNFGSGDLGDWAYCSDYSGASNPMPTITYSWSQ